MINSSSSASIFVNVSCHVVDLELLFIAMSKPAPLACCIVASIFVKSSSIFWLLSNYMLTKIILALYILTFKTTVSISDSCCISKVSIRVLVTTIAAYYLTSPGAKILYLFGMPTILFCIVYGS